MRPSRAVATDMLRAAAGVRDWQRWIARSAGGLSPLLVLSCLVTDRPEYGEPNVPAHLVRVAPDDFVKASGDDLLCELTGVASERRWMPFQALVSDANFDDVLEARIFVNNQWNINHRVRIPKTGKAEREPLVICADRLSFNSPCNLVEVRVSRDFSLDDPSLPEVPGDLSILRYWIFDEAVDEQLVLPAQCREQQMLDGGAG
jgi:hypothetical protein